MKTSTTTTTTTAQPCSVYAVARSTPATLVCHRDETSASLRPLVATPAPTLTMAVTVVAVAVAIDAMRARCGASLVDRACGTPPPALLSRRQQRHPRRRPCSLAWLPRHVALARVLSLALRSPTPPPPRCGTLVPPPSPRRLATRRLVLRPLRWHVPFASRCWAATSPASSGACPCPASCPSCGAVDRGTMTSTSAVERWLAAALAMNGIVRVALLNSITPS